LIRAESPGDWKNPEKRFMRNLDQVPRVSEGKIDQGVSIEKPYRWGKKGAKKRSGENGIKKTLIIGSKKKGNDYGGKERKEGRHFTLPHVGRGAGRDRQLDHLKTDGSPGGVSS